MKKLLILMMVLLTASWANAELTLVVATVDDPVSSDYVDVGDTYSLPTDITDTIWIGVYNDIIDADLSTKYMQFASSATNPPAEWTGEGLIYSPPAVPGSSITFYGYSSYYMVDWLAADLSPSAPYNTGVGTVFGCEFQFLFADVDVLVQLLDDDAVTILDELVIYVPEPMTIALLGLGAVMLRRSCKRH